MSTQEGNRNSVINSTNTLKNSLNSGASTLWESVRTIIELQNQAPDLKPAIGSHKIPMSFNQERLWLISQLRPESSAYNIPFAFRLFGNLNIDNLEKSLKVLLQRHQVLRTTFAEVSPNKAIQRIKRPANVILKNVNLQTHVPCPNEAEIINFIKAEAQRPFRLGKDPLFRATLLNIANHDHILVLNIHHIVFDGWSEGILFHEISILYESFCKGTAHSLKPLLVQYADFSVWQRQWIQGAFRKALLDYWRTELGSYLEELALPITGSRPTHRLCSSDYESFHLSEKLTGGLKALASQERTTLFPILLAAFKVLLYHYTQQIDICVCTPTANRNRSELKGLIGYFANLLVLRTNLSGNPSFRQFLGRVKQSTSGAIAHQDLPTQELGNCLEGSQAPLSQVLFALQNTPQTSLALSGLKVERLGIDNGTADFDLFLSLTQETGTIKGILKYSANLFKTNTIVLLLEHYVHILTTIIASPDSSIDELLTLMPGALQSPAKMRNHHATETFQIQNIEKQPYLSPRNETEEKLVTIWQAVLNIQSIGVKDNFFEIGGKSLAAFEIFTQIEAIFGLSLPLATLLQAPTVEQLAQTIYQKDESVQYSPLVPLQPQGARRPFFCIHGKGGNVLGFLTLASLLGSEQPFYGLQARALDGKSVPHSRLEDIAADYIQQIKSIQPEGPYFLGGYSLGGTIAFEIAQQLRCENHQIGLLVFLDSIHEISPLRRVLYDITNLLRARVSPIVYLRYLFGLLSHRFEEKIQTIRSLRLFSKPTPSSSPATPLAQINSVTEQVRYRVLKANVKALKNYKPKVYPGDLIILRATQRNVSQQHVYRVPELGWRRLVDGIIEVYPIPSFHGKMLVKPHVSTTAQVLKYCLDKAQRECSNATSLPHSEQELPLEHMQVL